MTEGTLAWAHGTTWYRVDEGTDPHKAPLVLLHGGPGCPHDYIAPIAELAQSAGRTCVLYDQIGCGRSQHLPDAPSSFWTPELFLDELRALLDHLGITDAHHLLGQSWGGMLGMEYAVTQPAGLRSLVIANSPASMELWVSETARLRADLPQEVQDTLARHEEAGTTDDPEYEAAVQVFYDRHLCRITPMPEPLERSFALLAEDPTVYHTMNGPSEFHVIGSLRSWDITPQLGRVQAPTLVLSGEFDEATPEVVRPLVAALPSARWELMSGTSHCSHLEQPERFLSLVENFLSEHD